MSEFIEDSIYPLTIVADRYNGAYSGGSFLAWNLDADEVPEAICGDDCSCHEFWLENDIVCGKGRTVSEALADLYVKLKDVKETKDESVRNWLFADIDDLIDMELPY